MYSSAVSICSCNPSGVSDINTKSSANINPDTVSSPIVTHCFVASAATILSLLFTFNTSGDSVHSCATPCKIPTYLDVSPSSITELLAHSVIFVHHSPYLSFDPNSPHNSCLHICLPFFLEKEQQRYFLSRFFVVELSFEWCLTSPFCAACARRGSLYFFSACLVSGSLFCSDYCHSTPTHQRLEVCVRGRGLTPV